MDSSAREVVDSTELLGFAQALTAVTALELAQPQRAADTATEGQLLIDVAHDLRSPMAAVQLLVERLRSGHSGPVTPLMARQLGLIHSATAGLCTLVDDLMASGRRGGRELPAEPARFAVEDVLRDVRDVVSPIAEEQGLMIRVAAPAGMACVGYPTLLRRALLNLAVNAVKGTERGVVDLTAEEGADGFVTCSVTDTGRGMPPVLLRALTAAPDSAEPEPVDGFSRAGLGLRICRRLVHQMGGDLSGTSDSSRGTRIDLRIPRVID